MLLLNKYVYFRIKRVTMKSVTYLVFFLFVLIACKETDYINNQNEILETNKNKIIYYINTNGQNKGDGSINNPWNSLDNVNSFLAKSGAKPNTIFCFMKNQTFEGSLYIQNTQGYKQNEVIFTSCGEGQNNAIIKGNVVIAGESYIIFQNLKIDANNNLNALTINKDDNKTSNNITIQNLEIYNFQNLGIYVTGLGAYNNIIKNNKIYNGNGIGIYLSSKTYDYPDINKSDNEPLGCGNIVIGNKIYNNKLTGIAFNALNLQEYSDKYICNGLYNKQRNSIISNHIYNNEGHGIEITSNHILIKNNIVENNGLSEQIGGFSGIHLFDRFPNETPKFSRGGDYNIIYNNISKNNNDKIAKTDGNGIQMDMWCDNNLVFNNITYNNDGAGIIVFGADNNKIFNNLAYNNGQAIDTVFGKAEIAIFAAEVDNLDISEVSVDSNYYIKSENNLIINNIGHSKYIDLSLRNYCNTNSCNAALLTDSLSFNTNIFSNNIWFIENSLNTINYYNFNSYELIGKNIQSWNSYLNVQNDYSNEPTYTNISNYNFYPVTDSFQINKGKQLNEFDFDFNEITRPQNNFWDIGPYEYLN